LAPHSGTDIYLTGNWGILNWERCASRCLRCTILHFLDNPEDPNA